MVSISGRSVISIESLSRTAVVIDNVIREALFVNYNSSNTTIQVIELIILIAASEITSKICLKIILVEGNSARLQRLHGSIIPAILLIQLLRTPYPPSRVRVPSALSHCKTLCWLPFVIIDTRPMRQPRPAVRPVRHGSAGRSVHPRREQPRGSRRGTTSGRRS